MEARHVAPYQPLPEAARCSKESALLHPFERIPEGGLRRFQIPIAAVALSCLLSLGLILPRRETNTLLDLVAAGSGARARAVLADWPPEHRVAVAYAVGLDFLMNPAYMTSLAIAVIWSGRRFRTRGAQRIAGALAWLAGSVVVTNTAENIGLYVALTTGPSDPWPRVVAAAHYWAGFVILACLAFALAGLLRRRCPITHSRL